MFSRNADRPAPDDRRVVPNSPAATPQGVRDVSARECPRPAACAQTAASSPDLSVLARADRLEGTLKVRGHAPRPGHPQPVSVEATTVQIDEGAS